MLWFVPAARLNDSRYGQARFHPSSNFSIATGRSRFPGAGPRPWPRCCRHRSPARQSPFPTSVLLKRSPEIAFTMNTPTRLTEPTRSSVTGVPLSEPGAGRGRGRLFDGLR